MRRVHYSWIVAAVGLVTLITSAGFRSTTGILIVPLQDEFGWNRATIGFAVAINLVIYGLGGPFAAAFVDRYGIRRVITVAVLGISVGAGLSTVMNAPWQLDVLWGVVNGAATGAISVPLAAMIAHRWFVKRRGLVTGLLTASNATGQLIFLPLLALIVTHWGWRYAAGTAAAAALVIVLPLSLVFIRDRPFDIGIAPYGGDVLEPPPAPTGGSPFATAVRTLGAVRRSSSFWLLAGSFFICGASTNGLIGTHLIPAAMDHGFGEVAAASLLATIGVFDLVGTVCSGWLTDRYDPRLLLAWYYGLRGLSLLALPYAFGAPRFGLILFVVFYGLDWVATVPPTVALTAEIFGRESVGIVFGWIFAAHMAGAAAAAWGAGAARTWFGGYGWAFGTSGLLCLFAVGLVTQISRPAPRAILAPV
jgi:MFS family permease